MTDALLTVRDLCRLMRRTSGWFYQHRDELERAGFPRPLPVVGRYDPKAVQAWIDRQNGTAGHSTDKANVVEVFERWGKSA